MRSERDSTPVRSGSIHRAAAGAMAFAIALAVAVPAGAQDRTPFGAEASGNAAGTIPAWQGGLKSPLAGHQSGGPYADPYEADAPMFAISAANLEQYRAQLSPGQIALLQKYPTLRMNVYPTRRSAAFPDAVYAETAANAGVAKLAPGGNGVTGTTGGIPFRQPKDGLEAIWNTLLRYRGDTYATRWGQAAVTRGGAYTMVNFSYEFDFGYGNLANRPRSQEDNILVHELQTITGPARLAGQILLVNEPVDLAREPRSAWIYEPGLHNVRPAPYVEYDNPATASDGLATSDDLQMFNGATDRYEWKLVGKQEMFIPYNSYKLSGNRPAVADVLGAGHLNPDYARYELHRVWVVEATLKEGARHIYKKRVFYIDEDSWTIAVTDKYDMAGELWRVSEQHSINCYDVPMLYATVEVHSDLKSGRYLVLGLRNGQPRFFEKIKRSSADYTPAVLRMRGVR
jgi:hypothetical protein